MKKTPLYSWWLRRRMGGRPLHKNPLCRNSDRLQQISAWTWFLIAAVTIPLVAVAVAPAIVDSQGQPPMWPTTAVVEQVAENPVVAGPSAGITVHRRYTVRVRWIARSGSVRRGSVNVFAAPRRGDSIRIWATRSGGRVAAARPRAIYALDLIVLTINLAVDICLISYGAHRLLRWQLDRRRIRTWEVELSQLLT